VPSTAAEQREAAVDPGGRELPIVIQGGMGVGVSGWRLASAVARTGQLGVVSGVALDALLARRLQLGDQGGHMRRALAAFPSPAAAERILRRYFVAGGIGPATPFRPIPRLGLRASQGRAELIAAGNFVEVLLAKEDHDGTVGVNYLEKIQMATPPAVYGAMLAGVDYVLMGAGIPVGMPALLNALAGHLPVELPVTVAEGVADGQGESHPASQFVAFDPASLVDQPMAPLHRPTFLAIISSAVLATYLTRSDASRPDGFVLEGPVAGGHSAPPRGRVRLDDNGEPVYGPRDIIDLGKVAATGLPFWLAGGYSTPAQVRAARAAGAAGVQVGSPFALCGESGIEAGLRRQLLDQAAAGSLTVRNSALASPAGFPFKVAELAGTIAHDAIYADRPRLCDLGYLRVPFHASGGKVSYRCAAEPVEEYARKGGTAQDAAERRCLCNGLLATIGLGQRRGTGYIEPPLVTLGQDLDFLPDLLGRHGHSFRASDVVAYLLGA
jgi:NAD(P)H-dependent flavin oxidoreductase YrpB (nitropropane dioxygenase family)